jgi:hypothetical protein
MAHQSNLVVKILFEASILFPNIVKHIEDLFQSFYYFFFHSQKRHLEFLKLINLMKVKGSKILHNVKNVELTCSIQQNR